MTFQDTWQDLPCALDGVTLSHRYRSGAVPILMVHGIGPGTTGRTNFGPLLDLLAPRFAPHLIDLAGFGASGRLAQMPYFDVDFWLRQIGQAIDTIVALHGRAPLLIGNSVGGALAMKIAAARAELAHVIAIGAPVAPCASAALRAFWKAPADAATLAASMRPMTAAYAQPAPGLVTERLGLFLTGGYAAYFDLMLADPDACLAAAILTRAEAANIRAHVSILHGRQDRACLPEATIAALLPLLPDADLTLLGACGHNVIAERPDAVIATIARLEKVDPA